MHDHGGSGAQALRRVLIVDDHRTFTDLVRLALAAEDDLECVGAAHDAASARVMTARHHPDVLLMDVNLGKDDGLALAADLATIYPRLCIIVLSAHCDARVVRRAAAAEVCALVPKDGSFPDLLRVLRTPPSGRLRVHPGLIGPRGGQDRTAARRPPAAELTRREQSVLELLAEGREVRAIARELGISLNTCRGHVKTLLIKLDAHSQLEAVVVASRNGLLGAPRRR